MPNKTTDPMIGNIHASAEDSVSEIFSSSSSSGSRRFLGFEVGWAVLGREPKAPARTVTLAKPRSPPYEDMIPQSTWSMEEYYVVQPSPNSHRSIRTRVYHYLIQQLVSHTQRADILGLNLRHVHVKNIQTAARYHAEDYCINEHIRYTTRRQYQKHGAYRTK